MRTVPGRSQGDNLCRRCHREFETLAHVLGACPFGELLRNSRHHAARSAIANALREQGYEAYEEVHGLARDGSHRRIDIIAFKPRCSQGYIIDPTIRFESQENQPEEVDAEKRGIYEETVDFYKEKYNLEFIQVIGLLIGARGTIPKFFVDFCTTFGLTKEFIFKIAISTLKSSIFIYRNHAFGVRHKN